MKAAYYERFGPAEEVLTVGETPTPSPAAGEVLVRIMASGGNPSDVKLRAGRRPGGLAPEMPFPRIIPHSDGAGVVEAVGDGVDAGRVGERVWVWNGQWERPFGTCAEYIALPSAQAIRLPEQASFAEGACLGIPAMTAYACVYAGGPVAGKTALITGAAGSVGRYAVQCAALGGAEVIATVSGPVKAEEARAAGATHIVNYREEPVADRVAEITGGRGVERVVDVDFGANLATTAAVLARGGVVSTYASMGAPEPTLPFYPLMFKNVTLRLVLAYLLGPDVYAQGGRDLAAWIETGRLTHKIAATRPLDEAAAAHQLIEAGDKIGGVIVETA